MKKRFKYPYQGRNLFEEPENYTSTFRTIWEGPSWESEINHIEMACMSTFRTILKGSNAET